MSAYQKYLNEIPEEAAKLVEEVEKLEATVVSLVREKVELYQRGYDLGYEHGFEARTRQDLGDDQ